MGSFLTPLVGLALVGAKLMGAGTTVTDAPPNGDKSGATPPPEEPKPKPKPRGLSPAQIKRDALMADASFHAAMVGTPASPSIPGSVSAALIKAGQAYAAGFVASATTAIEGMWNAMTPEEKSALWRGDWK